MSFRIPSLSQVSSPMAHQSAGGESLKPTTSEQSGAGLKINLQARTLQSAPHMQGQLLSEMTTGQHKADADATATATLKTLPKPLVLIFLSPWCSRMLGVGGRGG